MDCKIRFVTTQNVDGNETKEVMEVNGKYTKRPDFYYVTFSDDEEIKTQRLLKFNDKVLFYTVSGQMIVKMSFMSGKRTENILSTPFGNIDIQVYTKKYSMCDVDNRVNVSIEYEMFTQNGSEPVENVLTADIFLE